MIDDKNVEELEKQAKELSAQGNKKEADKIFRLLKKLRITKSPVG